MAAKGTSDETLSCTMSRCTPACREEREHRRSATGEGVTLPEQGELYFLCPCSEMSDSVTQHQLLNTPLRMAIGMQSPSVESGGAMA